MTTLIDIRSDTVTKPTSAMRRAMAEAEVGDDVLDGDPTVLRLQARVAQLLGKHRFIVAAQMTVSGRGLLSGNEIQQRGRDLHDKCAGDR